MPQAVPPPPQQQQAYRAANPPVGGPYPGPVPGLPQQAWPQQGFSQGAYPPRASPTPAAGIPYAYGQLPANANPNDPKSQHPIPGSYNRQTFNPKTQSFVPANGIPMQQGPPPPPPSGPYGGSSPRHGSPQFHSPHMSYSGYQQQMPHTGYAAAPPPGAYGMTRQGSSNSMTPYHAMQQQQQPPPHGPPPHGPQHMPPTGPMHMPPKPAPAGPAGQSFSHLPTYGNPATLPQKPST